MMGINMNRMILCVDDEEGILVGYRSILADNRSQQAEELADEITLWRQRRKGGDAGTKATEEKENGGLASYELVTATSGEEAVAIVRRELANGRQFAMGFFDMSMPGGMDGLETVRAIRELDSQMLCAFVTAYTDRSPDQIAQVIAKRDDWLYLNKPFTSGELLQIAHHLVSAWNQRRKEEALMTNMQMMQNGLLAVLEFVRDVNKIQPLLYDTLLEGILSHFLKLTSSTDGFIAILSEGKEPFQLGLGVFQGFSDFSTPQFTAQWRLAESAMREMKAVVENKIAAAPISQGKNVLGVLVVQQEKPISNDPRLLDIYAMQAGNMIQHSHLYKELASSNIELSKKNQELMSLFQRLSLSEKLKEQYEQLTYLDFLTGVPNRRFLETRLQEEITRCRRHHLSMSFLMVDIDHFKAVNDTFGHAAGDYVLQEMGKILLQMKRSYDLVARYGGEEFTVVFGHIATEHAWPIAERLRQAVEEHTFFYEGKRITITVSIGIAFFDPEKGASDTVAESVLHQADEALYLAKKAGRNCCVLYGAEESRSSTL